MSEDTFDFVTVDSSDMVCWRYSEIPVPYDGNSRIIRYIPVSNSGISPVGGAAPCLPSGKSLFCVPSIGL